MSIHTLLREAGPLILGDCAVACRVRLPQARPRLGDSDASPGRRATPGSCPGKSTCSSQKRRRDAASTVFSVFGGRPAIGANLYRFFFGWERSPTKIDETEKSGWPYSNLANLEDRGFLRRRTLPVRGWLSGKSTGNYLLTELESVAPEVSLFQSSSLAPFQPSDRETLPFWDGPPYFETTPSFV